MKIILSYSLIGVDGKVLPYTSEVFQIIPDDDSSREPARKRWAELKANRMVANLAHKIIDAPTYRVVRVRYIGKTKDETYKKGIPYTFKVDFTAKKDMTLWVDEIDGARRPTGALVPVVVVEPDKKVAEDELGFDPKLLRSAYRT